MTKYVDCEPYWPNLVRYFYAVADVQLSFGVQAVAIMPGDGGVYAVDSGCQVWKLGSCGWEPAKESWETLAMSAYITYNKGDDE